VLGPNESLTVSVVDPIGAPESPPVQAVGSEAEATSWYFTRWDSCAVFPVPMFTETVEPSSGSAGSAVLTGCLISYEVAPDCQDVSASGKTPTSLAGINDAAGGSYPTALFWS